MATHCLEFLLLAKEIFTKTTHIERTFPVASSNVQTVFDSRVLGSYFPRKKKCENGEGTGHYIEIANCGPPQEEQNWCRNCKHCQLLPATGIQDYQTFIGLQKFGSEEKMWSAKKMDEKRLDPVVNIVQKKSTYGS